MRAIDPRLELLPRRRILCQIVLDDVDAFSFQVGDRIAAARSRRLEVHLDALRHLCLQTADGRMQGLIIHSGRG
jgi:hypothetical protein